MSIQSLKRLVCKDSKATLSKAELEEIKIARKQAESSMVEDWESVYGQIDKGLL